MRWEAQVERALRWASKDLILQIVTGMYAFETEMTEIVGTVTKAEKMSKMTLAMVVSEQAGWSMAGGCHRSSDQ